MREDADAEEPDCKAIEPDAGPVGEDLRDLGDEGAAFHEGGGEGGGELRAHGDEGGACEAGWANRDEHSGSGGFIGELLGEEAVHVGAVDHYGELGWSVRFCCFVRAVVALREIGTRTMKPIPWTMKPPMMIDNLDSSFSLRGVQRTPAKGPARSMEYAGKVLSNRQKVQSSYATVNQGHKLQRSDFTMVSLTKWVSFEQ